MTALNKQFTINILQMYMRTKTPYIEKNNSVKASLTTPEIKR